jgi:phosphoglycolate phosphatase
MRGVRVVIYDLDGTLLDAFEDIAGAINGAFGESGLPALTVAEVKQGVGDGARKLVERCLEKVGAGERFEEVYPAFMRHYEGNTTPSVRLYDGVLEALAAVRGLGLKQAILTNKPQAITDGNCARLGLDRAVDGIWGGREGTPLKPHPESLMQIARRFGAEAAACAVVGDYRADFEVARATGARMIGVTWGIYTAEQVAAERPDAVIDAMGELPGLFHPIK